MSNPVIAAQQLKSPILDILLVEQAQALVKDKFPKMVSYFLEDCSSYIGQITEGLEALSAEAIVPPAHTLKSSSLHMGAIRLSDIAEKIERVARETMNGKGSIVAVPGLLKELRRIFEETKLAFQNYTNSH